MEAKIKINNQVVCMRKFVKQGKIRIINKFVKEIQLLRNRKGGEQKISKCQRKADRLLKEVAILKKIKPDTVSRIALSKSKDWKAVLSQKGVSPEDRCFALLASYGPVQQEVDKFYSENSYLTFKIPTLIQEWEEKTSTLTQKNQNSFKLNSKSNEITKRDPSHSAMENKSIEVKSGKKSSEPRKQSAMLKDDDNCDTLKVTSSEDIMDDSGNEGTKDTRSGHCVVGNRNQEDSDEEEEESDDNQEKSENEESDDNQAKNENEESDDNQAKNENEESDDNQANNDDKEEESDDNQANSEDNEEDSENNEEDSEESHMHTDDEKEEEENSWDNGLKNKSKASSIKESKMKSKPAKKDSNILPLPPVKTAYDFKNKIPSLQKNVPLDSNSTKAVALVNLNEMMDMDEIPIVSSKAEEKQDIELKKRKKDSFFLKDGEEEFSESDQSEDEDSNDGTFNHKNVHSDSFNKKGTFVYHGRTKMEDNSSNFRNKGFSDNARRGKKFEKGYQKFQNDFHPKQKFDKFNKNDSKPYSEQQNFKRFNKNDSKPYSEQQNFKRFNKNDSKPYSDQQNFKKSKWNRDDESDRKGSKPFGNFQEKKQTYSKNKPGNHPRNDFGKTVKKDEPPLHPSWEAKRKLKQATNTKFQGKRMVFDD